MFHKKNALIKKVCLLLLFAMVALAVIPTVSKTYAADKETQLKRVAQEFLLVGKAQYDKQMYDAALVSFQKANSYRQYLTSPQQNDLDALLTKVQTKTSAIQSINDLMNQADTLIEEGKYQQAKSVLEDLSATSELDNQTRTKISDKISEIDTKIFSQQQQLQSAYNDSVALYEKGMYEEARSGFEEIVLTGIVIGEPSKTAQDYLIKINEAIAEKTQTQQVPASEELDAEEELLTAPATTQEITDSTEISGSYLNKVNQQRTIQQSYTKAIVDDALAGAEDFRAKQEYDKAKAKLVQAQAIVSRNKLALGDDLYKEYAVKLEMMDKQITEQLQAYDSQQQQEKLTQGKQIAEQFRQQQEIDRQKRIAELLENSRNFQKQQRYEEALKQLELLLAIDPQNDIALTSKMLLEDTINFRKEIELRKELDREEIGSFHKLAEATIPYDHDITYSRKWAEISAKRAGDLAAGMSKEDMATYDQLSQIVDLSALSPETPLIEAIDIIRNSTTPPLKIVVSWKDLSENAYIDTVTAINMEGVASISLQKGLELLLSSVSGGLAELVYNVEDGVIVIGTKGQVKVRMTTEVYDITELLLPKIDATFDLGSLSDLGQGEEATGGGGGTQNQVELEDEGDDSDQAKTENVQQIITAITTTINPDSWYENGGTGTILVYQDNQLIVLQTPEIQKQVKKLIEDMQKKFGMQISIEARFLIVKEDFLENINLDFDATYDFGGKLGVVDFQQNNLDGGESPALKTGASYGNLQLDDLQVNFLLQATQQTTNSRQLNAPKLTVINGESAAINVLTQKSYVGDYEFENVTQSGDNANTTIIADPTIYSITDGVGLNITPTISADRKYVLLNVSTTLSDSTLNDFPIPDDTGFDRNIQVPTLDSITIYTRVSVPDQGTLLIGGLKINQESEIEKGVPILSKIPYFGRLFKNSNMSKEQYVLLILVKPSIIIRDEAEQDAANALKK
jgi:general secretion pathway protein D